MENGSYGNANTDFRTLVVDRLPIHCFDSYRYSGVGCGANALALLTGINPLVIQSVNKGKAHYSDQFMRKYLRKFGISSYKMTKCNLTGRTNKEANELMGYIGPNNVMLASQLIKRNEASWFLYWNGTSYHNFDLDRANFATLLNFPIITSYVLYNAKWVSLK